MRSSWFTCCASSSAASFTASSTVRNFAELVGTDVGSARVASIGPITSATARELGMPVHVEAEGVQIGDLIEVDILSAGPNSLAGAIVARQAA